MYTATIKNVAPGKADASAIYCETKSGNIYKLRTSVPAERATTVIAQIKSAKVINIQHWIKVKEGTFTPKPANARSVAAKKGWETRRSNAEDIEHATKMWEFEKSGDEAGAIAYLESRTTPMWDELKAQEADSGLAS